VPIGNGHLGAVALDHRGWWGQSRHHTINRTLAAAALSSIIGGPLYPLIISAVGADLASEKKVIQCPGPLFKTFGDRDQCFSGRGETRSPATASAGSNWTPIWSAPLGMDR